MIPKIIHYCWFGGNPLSDMAKKCIASWEKYCPDYEIKEWNESNFDVNICNYSSEAYKSKKWAFVSDVARLYALVNFGGVYMDTDVEVIKPIDNLLQYEAVSGFESETQISTGLMASIPHQVLFEELLNDYADKHFIREDGSYDLTTNVTRITNVCNKYGFKQNNTFQMIKGFTLLPKDYLCPKDHETHKIHITNNTLVIHHFDGSWHSAEDVYYEQLKRKMPKYFPKSLESYLAKFISVVKYNGVKSGISQTLGWIKRKR
ncbi:glycosyl transferase [Eubacteriaceae bacterium RF-744-FAT-4]|uniref:Glycosyl transferase n=2 Tax=Pseudoramibacter porci TaxID=2606631 RepID=A0A7X2TAU3_9FIRM|nr:glycosyl transferase [Pseudoramibacter porci]